MPIATGTRLGPYEVHDFIGQGAMGLVYRAYHVQLERTVAVKVLQAMAPDPDTTARFRHEAQAIARMRHPNVLNVYDFGEDQGSPYMIVEYVPGGNLADRLSQGHLDQAKALHYLRGISAGLDYAHGLGVVHRDVKPANVLLEKDDTPVLADFGLAKLLQGSSLKSMSGVTTGTPAYMAPEQVVGGRVGPAADRYSLATIAYEILTGVIPFDGEGLMELLYAQVHREPRPPSARNASLSSDVDAVIMRGLAKDPASRWESCTAFVDALAAALATKAESAVARTMVTARAVASNTPVAAAAAADAAPTQPLAKQRSRKGLMAFTAAAALLVLLIVGTAGYFATRQRPSLSVSPSTAVAGDTVVVTASHIPANQAGEIRIFSAVRTFPFQADAGGGVNVPLTIPRDIGAGVHTVSICWAAVCRASASIRVIEPAAFVTPSSEASPSSTPTAAAPPTGTPGRGPTPGAAASPTPRASSAPAPAPTPTPKATPTPTPSPLPARSISLSSTHFNAVGGSTNVSGSNFSPGATATITFTQGGTTKQVTSVVGSNGSFVQTLTVSAVLLPGSATIKACDPNGCAPTQTVQVTAL